MEQEQDEPVKILNFNEALKLVKQTTSSNVHDIWIPSLDKTVKFKQISAAQHKSLLKCALDASVFVSPFNIALYNIIKDCIVGDVDVKQLTTLDKIYICYNLRMYNIGKYVKYTFELDGKVHDINFDISKAIENFKQKYKKFDPGVVSNNGFLFNVSIPTLSSEKNVDEYITRKHLIKFDKANADEINNILTEIVVYNISQFIDDIKYNDQLIEFNKLDTEQKTQILNSLDTKSFDLIYHYVSNFNSIREGLMTNEYYHGDKKVELYLDINPAFFAGE